MTAVEFDRLRQHTLTLLEAIYSGVDCGGLADALLQTMRLCEECPTPPAHENLWSERDLA